MRAVDEFEKMAVVCLEKAGVKDNWYTRRHLLKRTGNPEYHRSEKLNNGAMNNGAYASTRAGVVRTNAVAFAVGASTRRRATQG